MSGSSLQELKQIWLREVLPKLLPFADAATKELPLVRLLRLSLFQASVGMMMVLLYAASSERRGRAGDKRHSVVSRPNTSMTI